MTTAQHNEIQLALRQLHAAMDHAETLIARANGRCNLVGITPEQMQQVESIICVVCERSGVTQNQIFSRRRPDAIAVARQVAMVLVRAKIGLPYDRIGEIFSRDHSNVIKAELAINDRISTDSKFACHFGHIKTEVEKQLSL